MVSVNIRRNGIVSAERSRAIYYTYCSFDEQDWSSTIEMEFSQYRLQQKLF